MAVVGLQTAIWSNRLKTLLLLTLFPALLFGAFFAWFAIEETNNAQGRQARHEQAVGNPMELALRDVGNLFSLLGPAILVWALVSFVFHRQIIFAFTEARPITRQENPRIYNIVENLCISRGLPAPRIGILDDDSLNAFAVGWNPEKAWIVFSKGIIEKLSTEEIEAVAAHELTHVMNKDGLLMVTIIVFIGAIAGIGEILFRIGVNSRRSSDSKEDGGRTAIMLMGVVLLALGYLILPLVQLAVSRKREYLADAGSVELTKNRDAMIGALRSISQDSAIESIKKDSVSALCIANPFPKAAGLISNFHEFFSTHPSIEHRIELLQKY